MAGAGFDFALQMDASFSIAAGGQSMAPGAPETAPLAPADLRRLEIKTAVADARCRTSTGYRGKVQRVKFALEQGFVDAHKADLDAWVESTSKGGK